MGFARNRTLASFDVKQGPHNNEEPHYRWSTPLAFLAKKTQTLDKSGGGGGSANSFMPDAARMVFSRPSGGRESDGEVGGLPTPTKKRITTLSASEAMRRKPLQHYPVEDAFMPYVLRVDKLADCDIVGVKLLWLGTERFDDRAEIVVSMPPFCPHVLGVGCGGHRQRLRHLARMHGRSSVTCAQEGQEGRFHYTHREVIDSSRHWDGAERRNSQYRNQRSEC